MRNIFRMSAVVAGGLALATPALAQSSEGEAYRGSLADGEFDRDLTAPELPNPDAGMIPLLKVDPETMRGLPGDPAELERGFGIVSRHRDGTVTEIPPSKDVIDALRQGGLEKKPEPNDAAAPDSGDPLFEDQAQDRAIVGEDGRIWVRDSATYPYRTVGLLATENGTCSSTLVGPLTVVTAAHCVYNHEKDGWVKETTFYPGANGEGNFPYRGYEYEETSIMKGFIDNYSGSYGSVIPWDLAVVTLKEPAGDQVGWLGYRQNDGWDFRAYNLGYPADKPFATMWRDICEVSGEEAIGTEYIHRCDTKPGSSGSSMYSYHRKDGKALRYVEGINVAEVDYEDTAQNYNIGVLFVGAYFNWIQSLKK